MTDVRNAALLTIRKLTNSFFKDTPTDARAIGRLFLEIETAATNALNESTRVCEHQFHHFGTEVKERRCVRCDELESRVSVQPTGDVRNVFELCNLNEYPNHDALDKLALAAPVPQPTENPPCEGVQAKLANLPQHLQALAAWAIDYATDCNPADVEYAICKLLQDLISQPVQKPVAEGWKLVPIVPTEKMVCAGIEAYQGKCEDSYAAMVAAAPAAPLSQVEPTAPCEGMNCGTTNMQHSKECLLEAQAHAMGFDLVKMGQKPVAEIVTSPLADSASGDLCAIQWVDPEYKPKLGDKLYAAPLVSQQADAEVKS